MHEIVHNNESNKYKPSLQRQGMEQTVVGDDKEILVYGKVDRFHCQFFRITMPCLIFRNGSFLRSLQLNI